MRLPCSLRMHKFLAVTEDGKKFAALNTHNRLVVWGTHFTYKHVIQQRWELVEGNRSNNPSYIEDKLDAYGASLVNHPYIDGTTLLGLIYEVLVSREDGLDGVCSSQESRDVEVHY